MSEWISCPLCESGEASPFIRTRDYPLRLPGAYTYVRCAHCGLVYLNPRPTWKERQQHYSIRYPGYYDRTNENSYFQRRAAEFGLWKRWRVVAPFVSNGRLLDVGCGTGDFMSWFQSHSGGQAFGVDRNPEIGQPAQQGARARIMIGSADRLAFPNETFEVVMLWTVLEHLENPLPSLRECVRVLRQGGILVVRTVAIESWGARWFGPYWVGYDAPRILTVFSRSALRKILEDVGAKILSFGYYFYDFHPFLWSLRNYCREHLPGALYQFLSNFPHLWLLQWITLPYFVLQTALGGNSFVTVLARKP